MDLLVEILSARNDGADSNAGRSGSLPHGTRFAGVSQAMAIERTSVLAATDGLVVPPQRFRAETSPPLRHVFLTTISSRGAEIRHPPGFLTSGLTFGPIDERGCSRVTLAYDHRLLDGRMVADILADLEQTLNGVIAEELAAMPAEDRLAA